ncbi:hypothetical protein Nepgr_003373 [Nepenthes gracilis]|uniref:Disease resistance protein At4g27190-like leucine-rich repeats domain-containing protein n=1 Tax=Nepenthes gracilis TaxID=150966 RepID=A0AAD3RZH7_NEPGR|nr:hypothetical protein Nepgr_003373 [Nepenthes gracilis]
MICNTKIKTQVSLPAIKHIEIKSESLQQVWGNHLPTESFGELETFQIYGAHKETTILPIAAAQSMKNLEELFVGSFDSAEKFSESEVPPSDGSSSELLLPQLRKLEIDTLPKLTCIPWRVLYIKNLRFLSISGVNNLKYLFPVSTISRFKLLEKLDIKNCAAMEAIIGGDGGASNTTQGTFTLPQLNSLQLEDLQQLVSFSSENLVLEFPRLEVMKFTRCPLAQKVDVFRSMQHVKELTVIECDLPEELYNVKARDGHGFLPQMNKLTLGGLPQLRSVSWAVLPVRNLHFLSISGTKGLKFLFSTAICKEFVELEEISIIQCEDLEVVVSYEEKDGDAAPVKIALPRLRIIELSDLPRLGCFSSGKYAFEFPSLEVVKINGSPIMERFSFASLSTPKLRSMEIGGEEEDTDSGLNETVHNLFNKEVCSRLDKHLGEKKLKSIDEVWHSPPAGEESAAAIFLKLSDLTLKRLPNLKHVWRKEVEGDHHHFGNLVKLSICYCDSLESLCPLSVAAALVQLKYLNIYKNRKLKEIIAKQTEETNNTQITIFPKLENLELTRLTSLLYFFRGNLKLVLPSLETIYSVHNHKMITFVNTENSAMEESETDNGGITKRRDNSSPHKHALFDDKVALSAMKEITIQQKGLEEVWSSDDLAVGSFEQVKILRMSFAPKATRVVSFRALQRMQNLEELEAVAFDSAEEFFELHDKIGGLSCPLLAQLRSLKLQKLPLLKRIPWKELDMQNLRSLNIATANKLTSLFSVSICKAFVLLEEIYVRSCENMEEIVAEEPEVDATSVKGTIKFPRIKTIELGDLPKLRSFCSLENTLKFPSLKSMELEGCPLMEKFSTGLLITPKLTTVSIEDEEVKIIDDLNKTLYSRLQNKEQPMEEERTSNGEVWNFGFPVGHHTSIG